MSVKIDLGTALRDALPTHNAPESLHRWAQEQARASGREVFVGDINQTPSRAASLVRSSLYAAGLLVAAGIGWTAGSAYRLHQQSASNEGALVAELVDTHVRSLMGDHLMDIRSTDQHTVKPWFIGKIDFAPRVLDLTARGFPLLGARTEYINGRTTAVLVYGRRRHFMNVFISPEPAAGNAQTSQRYRGYSILHWVAGGFSYWGVTDASPADLEAFHQAYESNP